MTVFDQTLYNAEMYEDDSVVEFYRSESWSTPELLSLCRSKQAIESGCVLDIGIGAGRTTRVLHGMAKGYVGIDISAKMVAAARKRFPGVDIRQLNLREIHLLSERTFSFVFAPYAVIDVLPHDQRQTLLSAVRNLLSPTGAFVFSTHNLNYRHAHAVPALDPRHPWQTMRSWLNHFASRKHCHTGEGYAILNDCSHSWRALHHYTDRRAQVRDLERAGFAVEAILGLDGRTIGPGDDDTEDWALHFLAR
jgi:SAM-dependent methyltransferase